METQKEQVRKYVREHGSITTMEAFFELGITRLAARISDLVKDGYDVKRTRIDYQLPSGRNVSITRYSNIRKRRESK